ncbi:MAG: 50S ribosomal protein L23 [Candidatus Paceibacterota bacterium]|jgi:large subunit ribosomal protein L23
MAIFGFKKRKDEKLQQGAEMAKGLTDKKPIKRTSVVEGKTSQKTSTKVPAPKVSVPALHSDSASNTASVILRPRITEKSGVMSQNGVYTFEVTKNSNKALIAKAVTTLYKVVPTKISIINTPIRNVFVKGRRGTVAGIKKAVVTVKKGDKIDFV